MNKKEIKEAIEYFNWEDRCTIRPITIFDRGYEYRISICREDKLIKTEFYRKKKGVFYDVSSKLWLSKM